MSQHKRTILVTGATGAQGGSVARHLLQNGSFDVRCMVRSLTAPKAQELFDQGAQLVEGNFEDVPSMVLAMNGCYGVFGVTNFWDPTVGYEGEIRQGNNLGDACKEANIQHLVYSSLDRNSGVPHFESKVVAEDHMKKCVPMTSLITSFYFENFGSFFPPKEENGEWVFSVPQKLSTKVPMYSVSETGGWVLQAFLHPELYIGHDLPAVSHYVSYPELVEGFTKVTGKKSSFNSIPNEVFKTFGFPGAEDIALNMQFFDDVHDGVKVDRRGGLEPSREIYTGESWEGYLNRTKWMQ